MLPEEGGDRGSGAVEIDQPQFYPCRFRKLQIADLIILEVADNTGCNFARPFLGLFNQVLKGFPGAVGSDGDRGRIEGLADDGDDIFGLEGSFALRVQDSGKNMGQVDTSKIISVGLLLG